MMDDAHIRTATVEDIPEVCERWWRLLEYQGPTGDGAPRNLMNEAAARDFLSKRIHRRQIHLAEVNQSIVGIASLAPENSPLEGAPIIWIVADVWVDKQNRKRGIGRALVQHCEQYAANMGADEVRLTVHPGNEGAVAFYETLGYGIQLLKMTKRIATKHHSSS